MVCDVESVGRIELVCAGRDGDLIVTCQLVEQSRFGNMAAIDLATLPSTDVYETLFNLPDPVGESAVQEKVNDDGCGGELFCSLEAILVVESKGDGSDYDSSVSQTELDIGVPVRLAELEAVQVVLQSIVGCVLAVCRGYQFCIFWSVEEVGTRNIIRRYSGFVCHVCDVVIQESWWWMTELKMKRGRSSNARGDGPEVEVTATRRPSTRQHRHHIFATMSPVMAEPVVQTIYRDPALFYWILLPITVVMVSAQALLAPCTSTQLTAPPRSSLASCDTTSLLSYNPYLSRKPSMLCANSVRSCAVSTSATTTSSCPHPRSLPARHT